MRKNQARSLKSKRKLRAILAEKTFLAKSTSRQ